MSKFDELAKFDALRKSGALTEQEFEAEKAKLLAGIPTSSASGWPQTSEADTPQGDRWWLASDGKWYPPTATPDGPPPPSPSSLTSSSDQWQAAVSMPDRPPVQVHPSFVTPPQSGQPLGVRPQLGVFTQASARTISPAAATTIGAGALLALGSLLPWATATTPFGSISKDGTSGDGVITLILAAVAILSGVLSLHGEKAKSGWAGLGAVAFALAGAGSIADMSSLPIPSTNLVIVSVGIGLWLCVIGSIVGFIAACSATYSSSRGSRVARKFRIARGPLPTRPTSLAGWYPDSQIPGQFRYWDGVRWTGDLRWNRQTK